MDLFSVILLGLVQGITEWVPVSSKTQVALVYLKLLSGKPEYVIPILLWVHFGTLIAAAVYFRREIALIAKKIGSKPFSLKTYSRGDVGFMVTALLFTGLVGLPILVLERKMFPLLDGTSLYLLMGGGLIVTGIFLISQKKRKPLRRREDVGAVDGVATGLLQGLSTLPGFSRAGVTSTALIWRSFDAESAFHLSFLLSIPSVAAAELVFYIGEGIGGFALSDGLALMLSSFIFGYLMLDMILRLVKKINIAYLVMMLGALIIAASGLHAG